MSDPADLYAFETVIVNFETYRLHKFPSLHR